MSGQRPYFLNPVYKDISFIFFIGFLLRLFYVLPLTYIPYSDAATYVTAAQAIAKGEGFLANYDMAEQYPLYVLFLSGFFSLFGENFLLIRLFQSFLDAITGVLTYFLGLRITENRRLGLFAGFIVAFYPDLILHTGTLMTEPLYTFLLTLFLLFWTVAQNRGLRSWWMLTGLMMGLTYLTRTILIGYIPMALLWEWKRSFPNWCSALRSTILLIVAAIMVCLPWMIRNFSAYGTLFPPSHQVALGFWGGNNPQANGYWLINPGTPEQNAYMARLSVPEKRKYEIEQALGWIKENPGDYLKLVCIKISRLFSLKPDGAFKGNFYGKYSEALIPVFTKAILWILVLLGMIYSFSSWQRLGLLYALCISHLLITIVFFAYARYLVPLVPALAVFAAYGLNGLVQLRESFRENPLIIKRPSLTTIILLSLLFANWFWDMSRNLGTLRVWQRVDSLKQFQVQTLEKLENKTDSSP